MSIITFGQSIKISKKVLDTNISTSIPVGKVFNLDIKIPKTEAEQLAKSTITSNTAIYKNNKYPVYATSKGKLFIVYPNKDRTGYNKKYLK
jgi:hypothetical protein